MVDQEILDQYTDVQWIAALIMAFLTFPIGAVVPAYFYIKASNGDGKGQGQWEAWGVILMNIIGIAAVELAGETGGKIAVGLFIVQSILGILAIIALFVFVGFASMQPASLAVVAALV